MSVLWAFGAAEAPWNAGVAAAQDTPQFRTQGGRYKPQFPTQGGERATRHPRSILPGKLRQISDGFAPTLRLSVNGPRPFPR